jgi:hypothetical protein
VIGKKDKTIDELFSEKVGKRDTISFNFFFFLKQELGIGISGNPGDQELWDTMDKYVHSRLDILKYLKSLEVLDRLRWLMLNYEQNLSLEFMKPTNIANPDEWGMVLKLQEKAKLCYQIFTYYSNKIRNDSMTELDEKLFSIIDPEVKTFWTSASVIN